jgi:hypothetical protein
VTVTESDAADTPALVQVILYVVVTAGESDSGLPPLPDGAIVPDQPFEAVHESGLPVVIQLNCVEAPRMSEVGFALKSTVIPLPSGVTFTVTWSVASGTPVFWQVIVYVTVPLGTIVCKPPVTDFPPAQPTDPPEALQEVGEPEVSHCSTVELPESTVDGVAVNETSI